MRARSSGAAYWASSVSSCSLFIWSSRVSASSFMHPEQAGERRISDIGHVMVCSVSRLAVGVSAWTIASASINRPRSAGSARINVYCQISASIPCLLRLLDTLNEGCLGLIVPPALPFPARYRPVSFPDVSRNMSRMVGVSGRAKLTCASGHVSRCVTQKTAAPVRVPPFSVSSSRTIGVSVARIGIAYALGCGVVVLALKLYPDDATLDPCRRYSGAAVSHEWIEYHGSRH